MCIACNNTIDLNKQEAFGERLLEMLNNSMTALLVALGHRSGLFDHLADGRPRSSAEIAGEMKLHERYVREWLGGMVAARIMERDVEADTYALPREHAQSLSRMSPTGNMAIFAQYVSGLAQVEDAILYCFRHGGGVPYEAFPRFHEVMEEDSGQSIVPVVIEELLPLAPGLVERLEAGIDVLDIGCGRGRVLLRMAEAFPRSRFTGYDLSHEAVDFANELARTRDLDNIAFRQMDLTHWREPESFDCITAFDAIHDQARPDLVLAAIREALRPGGVFLMQDIGLSSEPANNRDHPLGAMLYAVSCMHCMTVSLAQGGMGLGAAWGVELAEKMLREAGFENLSMHRFPHDAQNVYFILET